MRNPAARIAVLVSLLVNVAFCCEAAEQIGVEMSTTKVGRHEKIEMVISLGNQRQYRNPFDPDEVDLMLFLKTPSDGRTSVPAFYCQPYESQRVGRAGRETAWHYPVGMPVWKVRFAPDEVGTYEAVARLKDRSGTTLSKIVRFECVPSERKGFVRVAKDNPRFMELTTGEPFFAIGQNLAFVGSGQYVKPAKVEEIFGRLSENGANFLRIWTCCQDWAMAIEARKSVWGRSWGWDPPFVPILDDQGRPTDEECVRLASDGRSSVRLQPCHPVAVRPEARYQVSGRVKTTGSARLRIAISQLDQDDTFASQPDEDWTPFRYELTTLPDQFFLGQISLQQAGEGEVFVDGLSLKEAGGGPELLWEAAVNRPVRGYYNPTDCFMLDQLVELADQHDIYLQLCMITRDLYMGELKDPQSDDYAQAVVDAKKFWRYAVARWGYSTHVAVWEHFNEMDPGRPTDRFYTELGEYLEKIDPYAHLRTTSAWHPSPKDWQHAELDMAQMHHYLRPNSGEPFQDEVAVLLDKTRFMLDKTPSGPTIMGEFGLADERWGRSPYMKQDQLLWHFHNSLWASALSGASGTALFWWWEVLDAQDGYRHYGPLAAFLEDVPFNTTRLEETSATISAEGVHLVGLQGDDRVYLWLCNKEAVWWNLVVDKKTLGEVASTVLEVTDLKPGRYAVQWWDTDRGKLIEEGQRQVTSRRNVMRVEVPTFSRDIACKIVPRVAP
ncbi:MAG TPA: hypothetical protein VE890_13685 [Thermoguttaceae bacterium]|nr:hypothetical protein [Thermoguttaceae bacterium]